MKRLYGVVVEEQFLFLGLQKLHHAFDDCDARRVEVGISHKAEGVKGGAGVFLHRFHYSRACLLLLLTLLTSE